MGVYMSAPMDEAFYMAIRRSKMNSTPDPVYIKCHLLYLFIIVVPTLILVNINTFVYRICIKVTLVIVINYKKEYTVIYFKLLVTTFLLAGECINGHAQELKNSREQLFDYDWKFFLGDDPRASVTVFDDKAWRNLDLPHDWSI